MIKSENAMIDHFSKEYEQLVTVESNSSLVELFCLRILLLFFIAAKNNVRFSRENAMMHRFLKKMDCLLLLVN